jgi:UDP-N-acetylenolpyruvoylglucosamine reductase
MNAAWVSTLTDFPRVDFAKLLSARVSPATIVRVDEPLGRKTTLRVGGPADVYVEPASEQDLSVTLILCREKETPFFLLGRGSNLLVKDGGFRGVVICLAQPVFNAIETHEERIRCGAGVRLKALAAEAKKQSLTGLEFLEGIPGTVGGALRMNAGAMGGAIFDCVRNVRVMDYDGCVSEVESAALNPAYRSCAGLKNRIALAAEFEGRNGARTEIERQMNAFSSKRWSSQPAAPSAGCMFKNPETIPAGKLIQELGLKGMSVGGARVSLEHGNFIVNDGSATARDVLDLVALIRARAAAERGIELETEVEIIGE